MERLRICFQDKGEKELFKQNGLYFLQIRDKEKKISEREAVREYLDPESFGHIGRPHELFPNMVHLLDMKWNKKETTSFYSVSGVKFNVNFDDHERVKISITEGKLWPRPKKGLKY